MLSKCVNPGWTPSSDNNVALCNMIECRKDLLNVREPINSAPSNAHKVFVLFKIIASLGQTEAKAVAMLCHVLKTPVKQLDPGSTILKIPGPAWMTPVPQLPHPSPVNDCRGIPKCNTILVIHANNAERKTLPMMWYFLFDAFLFRIGRI